MAKKDKQSKSSLPPDRAGASIQPDQNAADLAAAGKAEVVLDGQAGAVTPALPGSTPALPAWGDVLPSKNPSENAAKAREAPAVSDAKPAPPSSTPALVSWGSVIPSRKPGDDTANAGAAPALAYAKLSPAKPSPTKLSLSKVPHSKPERTSIKPGSYAPKTGAAPALPGAKPTTVAWNLPRLIAAAKGPDNDSLEGKTLAGRYVISSLLGEGGMSRVYKAHDLKLDKIVALKTVLPHLVKQEKNLKRFQREAMSVHSLKHENIAEIYDSDIADGIPYISMEYIEGCTLMDLIDKEHYLSYARAVPLFFQIADALQHAHAQGIVHRDLKPSNVLIRSKDGREFVSIVDFGLAKMLPHADVQHTTLTHTGDVFGSPPYMSPQQCRGEKVDHRTDIYSFGCLMYETLTGRPPLVAETTVTTILKHLETIPPPTLETCPEAKVPGTLEAIVFKTLAKEPAARQQSMTQIQNELRSFLSLQEAGLEYKPISTTTKLNQIRVRHPKIVGWGAGILAVALIWALSAWWHWIHDWRDGTFHLIGFLAISAILGYFAYRAMRLNKKMENVNPVSPVWQLPWHSPPLVTTVDTPEQKKALDGFITKIEGGATLQNRPTQEELRKVLETLILSGCLEDVQNSSTHAIEVLRKQGKEKIEVTLIFKEFLADTLCAANIFDRAETAYRAVLAGWDEFDVFSSEVRCAVQLKLADVLFLQQKVVEAEDLYTTFLTRWDMLNQPHDAAYTLRLSRLADCYCKAEKYRLAEETYLKLIDLWQTIDPANSSLAFVKHAYTRVRCWRHVDQMKQFGKEVDSIEKNFGATSVHTIAAKSLYASCLWKDHDFPKAIEYRRSADNIVAASMATRT